MQPSQFSDCCVVTWFQYVVTDRQSDRNHVDHPLRSSPTHYLPTCLDCSALPISSPSCICHVRHIYWLLIVGKTELGWPSFSWSVPLTTTFYYVDMAYVNYSNCCQAPMLSGLATTRSSSMDSFLAAIKRHALRIYLSTGLRPSITVSRSSWSCWLLTAGCNLGRVSSRTVAVADDDCCYWTPCGSTSKTMRGPWVWMTPVKVKLSCHRQTELMVSRFGQLFNKSWCLQWHCSLLI